MSSEIKYSIFGVLLDQIAELRLRLKSTEISYEAKLRELTREISGLRFSKEENLKQLFELRKFLIIYGGHCGGCSAVIPHPSVIDSECECGFRQVYTSALSGVTKAVRNDDARAKNYQYPDPEPGGV